MESTWEFGRRGDYVALSLVKDNFFLCPTYNYCQTFPCMWDLLPLPFFRWTFFKAYAFAQQNLKKAKIDDRHHHHEEKDDNYDENFSDFSVSSHTHFQ